MTVKPIKKATAFIGASLVALGLSAGVALGPVHQQRDGQRHDDETVYKVGQTVTVTGTVNGDIFCAAQTVDIDAIVNGDVMCAGQTVTVNGTVHGNVRLAGQTVTVGAKIDGVPLSRGNR